MHGISSTLVRWVCCWVVCLAGLLPHRSLGACACTFGAFIKPAYAVHVFDETGNVKKSYSGTGTGPECITVVNAPSPPTYPLYVRKQSDNALVLVITQADADNCVTNQEVAVTNYVHCLTWTNLTGVLKSVAFFNANGVVEGIGMVGPGAIVKRCFTNGLSGAMELFVEPTRGAPLDEYVSADDQFWTESSFTTVIPQTGQANNGSTSPTYEPPGGTNVTIVSTNLVNYYAGTNGVGSTGAASQKDINNLGEALLRGLGPLIKDVETAVRQAAAQAHADATNNGSGGNGFSDTNIVSAITNQTQRVEDKFEKAISNLLAAATGTNQVGQLTNQWALEIVGATAAGEAMSSSANASWLGDMTNAVSGSLSNMPSLGSEDGLLVELGVGGYSGASLAKFDLRPSQWDATFGLAVGIIKKLGIAMMLGLFFIVVRKELKEAMWVYYNAMSGAGKSLTGASLGGAFASFSIRFGIAAAVTSLIALAPSVVMGYLESFGGGLVNILNFGMDEVTATGNAPLIAGTQRALILVDRFISYPTLMMCIVNYYFIQAVEAGLMAVALSIYRFLPVGLVFFTLGFSATAAEIVIDNRLSGPVEVVSSRGIESFPPGERTVDMSEDFFVTSVQGTNELNFSYSGQRARLVVVASVTTNTILGSLEPETPNATFTIQGFVTAVTIGGLALVVVFARRTMRLAFGGYRED